MKFKQCLFPLSPIRFFDLFEKYGGRKSGQLKLKSPKQLQEVLDISRVLLVEANTRHDPELEDKKAKLEQLKAVLEMYVTLWVVYGSFC